MELFLEMVMIVSLTVTTIVAYFSIVNNPTLGVVKAGAGVLACGLSAATIVALVATAPAWH